MNIKTTGYIPALDGLRALSILLVFAGHTPMGNFIPGGLGVTIFFFISGYIITNLLISEYDKTKTLNFKLFYIRRALRLYPALLLMLFLTTAFILFLGLPFPFKELSAALFYYENYYFSIAHAYTIFHYKILWSLAVEEHFYLVFPLVLFLFARKSSLLLSITSLLIIIALLIRLFTSYHYHADETAFLQTYILTHCRYDSILYGCLLSIIIHSGYQSKFIRLSTSYLSFGFGIALLLFTLIYKDEFFRQTFRYSLQGIALIILVSSLLFNDNYRLFNKIVSSNLLVYIGKLSYSIYLFHFLSERICKEYLTENTFPWYLAHISITIALSLFSYHIIEVPIMKVRKRYGSHSKV